MKPRVRIEPFPKLWNSYARYEAEVTVPTTMRYTHTNLDSNRNAVANSKVLVTIW